MFNYSFRKSSSVFLRVLLVISICMLSACATSGVKSYKAARGSGQNSESVKALLATIPENHPQRAELRRIAMQPSPEGFTAEEWLKLSMKFDIRVRGVRVSDSSYE